MTSVDRLLIELAPTPDRSERVASAHVIPG